MCSTVVVVVVVVCVVGSRLGYRLNRKGGLCTVMTCGRVRDGLRPSPLPSRMGTTS